MLDYNYPIYKAAAVQATPIFRDQPIYLDLDSTLKKAIDIISEASSKGAELIVFPETWLPGYPYWSLNSRNSRQWSKIWTEYLKNSVEVPSKETDTLCKAAKESKAHVVIGINERDRIFGGRMYNSILFISPKGEILGVHRKINITVQELLYHTSGDGGDNIKVYPTKLGNLGGLICGEHYQHLLVFDLIVQGLQINCSLWPGYAIRTQIPVMTRALCISGQVFSIMASTYIRKEDTPKNFYENHVFDQTFGGSGIIDPMGEYIAGPIYDREEIIYADIDLKQIPFAKSTVNITGIYSRWDILQAVVREESYKPVISMENTEKPIHALKEDYRKRIDDLERELDLLKKKIQEIEK